MSPSHDSAKSSVNVSNWSPTASQLQARPFSEAEAAAQVAAKDTVAAPTQAGVKGFGPVASAAAPELQAKEEQVAERPGFDFSKVSLFAGGNVPPSDGGASASGLPGVQAKPMVQRQAEPEVGDEEDKGAAEGIQRKVESASGDEDEPDGGDAPDGIQAKLTIGQPGDKYEQEADQMAARVVSMPEPVVQRQANSETGFLKETRSLGPSIQAKGSAGSASADFEQRLGGTKGAGAPLGEDVRSFMEPRFGADFSQVRVHTGSEAVQLNKEVGAQAFAHGNDVYFNSGKYSPDSSSGKELLAHELTHTIQQTGGKKFQAKPNKVGGKLQLKRVQRKVAKPTDVEKTEEKPEIDQASVPGTDAVKTSTEGQADGQPTQESTGQLAEAKPKATPTAQGESSKQTADVGKQPGTDSETVKEGAATGEPASVGAPAGGADVDATEIAGAQGGGAAASASGAEMGAGVSEGAGAAANATAAGPVEAGAVVAEPAAAVGSTAPKSADADPDFQSAVSQTKAAGAAGKQHAPAGTKAQEAQAAAVSPPAEQTGKAQANQVGEMQQAETPGFNKAAFKKQLMEKIKASAPKTLSEADKFKEQNKLGAVKSEMTGKVKDEKSASQKPLEEKTKKAPDTSGIPAKPVTPLAGAEKVKPVASVGAEKAVPKARSQAEVEAPLQQEAQQADQQMASADVTEEQLAKSNEPEFKSALTAKQAAKANAAGAPAGFRAEEKGELTQAQTEAGAMSGQKLQGMQGDRSQLMAQVAGQQTAAKGQDEQARAKVAADIQGIYDATKGKVEAILSGLDSKVTAKFDAGSAKAQKTFEEYVSKRMTAYRAERYSGVTGWARWGSDKLFGMPSDVNAFYVEGRSLYIQQMDGVIDQVVNLIAGELSRAKTEVAKGKQKVQAYLAKQPEDLRAVAKEAAGKIQGQFDSLEQSVDAKQDELIDTLATKYNEKLKSVDARITKLKSANKGLVDKAIGAITGVIATINKLKNMLLSVLKGAASAITGIIKDPIGFLGNLIGGIKKGFDSFVGNIMTHLQGGLIGWLTGAMGGIGIQLPKDIFSLPGIFDLAMQVLGMSWDYVRTKAVKLMGEPVVKAAEKTFEVFTLLQEKGPLGLWSYVQDQFSDLKEQVLGEIKNMVITQVIQAGVKWILGLLNPASAFVKACMLIYDVVMFFVNQGSQVLGLMKAVVDGVKAIASGSVGAVAKAIEGALVKSLPVVIGFMASLLGISGLTGKVQKIIKKVRGRIDKAIDNTLLKAKKAFSRRIKNKETGKITNKDKQKHKVISSQIIKTLKNKNRKKHKNFKNFYTENKRIAAKLTKKYQKNLKKGINLTIIFGSLEKEKIDNDLDIKIRIAPNTLEEVTSVDFDFDDTLLDDLAIEILDLVKTENNSLSNQKARKTYTLEKLNKKIKKLTKTKYSNYLAEIIGVNEKESVIYIYSQDGKRKARKGKIMLTFDRRYKLSETQGVRNPIYEGLGHSPKEYVMDRTKQLIPRKGFRYISKEQEKDAKAGRDLQPSNYQKRGGKPSKNELEHAMGVGSSSPYQSITTVGDRHIVGATGDPFNEFGRVNIDHAQIRRENLSALYTQKGMQDYLARNLNHKNSGRIATERELQAFVDVVRTKEVMIKGSIPSESVTGFMNKGQADKVLDGKKRSERPELCKQANHSPEKRDNPNQRSRWEQSLDKKSHLEPQDVIEKIHAIWSKS